MLQEVRVCDRHMLNRHRLLLGWQSAIEQAIFHSLVVHFFLSKHQMKLGQTKDDVYKSDTLEAT